MTYPHAMLDLETLATSSRAAICSIAVVRFNARRIAPNPLYLRVELGSCLKAGLEFDPATMVWWLQKPAEAARELWAKHRLPLPVALERVTAYLGADATKVLVWGNDPSFDNTILASAYRAVGSEAPWRHYNNRCFRTEKAHYDHVSLQRRGTHHHALDDAITQARHLMRMWRAPLF